MPLYLVTDAETGKKCLAEGDRPSSAVGAVVANRFQAVSVSPREAFDLGVQGVTLIAESSSSGPSPQRTDEGAEGAAHTAPTEGETARDPAVSPETDTPATGEEGEAAGVAASPGKDAAEVVAAAEQEADAGLETASASDTRPLFERQMEQAGLA